MMPAAKMLDPIVGLDVHMIQPPGPVPPIPVPHPHTGILFDPFDLAPYIGATVTIGGIPRAVAGSGTKMIPDHIPIGGVFVKPPANDSELFMGSSTVLADGEPFGYLALPLLSCWDVGMPPIPRPPRSLLPSMVLPTTVCMAVPSGVTVGGSPTVSMSALADRIGLGPLMAAYEFAKTGNPMALLGLLGPAMKGAKKLNKKFKFIKKSKCGRGVKLFGGKVSIGGDPVNLVTGEVLDDVVDALEPGGLFRWERFYGSSKCNRAGPMGHGFTHAYEHALELHPQAWRYRDADDTEIDFEPPTLARPESVNGGMRLRLVGASMAELRHRDDPVLRFILPESRRSGVARLVEVRDGRRTLELRHRGERLEGFVERGPDGREVRFVLDYDDLGRVIGLWRHGDGPRTCLARYAYDRRRGLLEKAQDAGKRLTQYAYDAERRLVSRTDPGGYAFAWRYDAKGRCVETRGRDGLWASVFEYHPELFETHELREGARFIVRYDANGRITEQIAPDGTKVVREIDAEGRVVLETDAAGRTMRWRYDEHGAHQDRVDGLGNVFPPEWEAPHLEDPMAPRWPETQYAREVGGVVSGADGRWLVRRMHPEAQARAAALLQQRPTEGMAVARHDALGRPVERRDESGGLERFEYGHGEEPRLRIDRDGRRWSTESSRWRMTSAAIDPLGNATRFEYNARELVCAVATANGGTTRYEYDPQDRLVSIRRESGVEEVRIYDSCDRELERRDGAGRLLARFEYDQRGLESSRMLDGGAVHRLRYDSFGRPIEASTDLHRVTLSWDRFGRIVEDLVDGRGVQRGGEEHERSTIILGRFKIRELAVAGEDAWEILGPAGDGHRVVRSGMLVLREHLGRTQELSRYDAYGRCLGRVRSARSDGAASVHGVAYRYSYEGELLQVEDSSEGVTRFGYDDGHRLVAECGPRGTFRFAHDAAGNLTERPGLSGVVVTNDDRLISTDEESFVYDDRFNLVERRSGSGRVEYRYDGLGQLVAVDDGVGDCWTASYDAWARCLQSGRGDRQRSFFWDGGRLAAEISPDGQVRVYLYASENAWTAMAFVDYPDLDAELGSGKVHVVFVDAVGLPRRIETADGTCVWSARRVDPFGSIEVEPDSSIEYAPRWAGHYYDADVRLHRNRFRDYDPVLGRYLQTDPSGQAGGTNVYAYPSNPLGDVDVLGLSSKCGGTSKGKGGSCHPSKAPPKKSKAGAEGSSPPPGLKHDKTAANPSPELQGKMATAQKKKDKACKIQSDLPNSKKKKVVACNGGDHLSGYNTATSGTPKGFNGDGRDPVKATKYDESIGHQPHANPALDPRKTKDGKINGPTKEGDTIPGGQASTHAEKQAAQAQNKNGTNDPVGISKDQCGDCRKQHQQHAQNPDRPGYPDPVVTADPSYTRVYNSDGSVDIYAPDGNGGHVYTGSAAPGQEPSATVGDYEGIPW